LNKFRFISSESTIEITAIETPTIENLAADNLSTESSATESHTIESPTIESHTIESPTTESPTIESPTIDDGGLALLPLYPPSISNELPPLEEFHADSSISHYDPTIFNIIYEPPVQLIEREDINVDAENNGVHFHSLAEPLIVPNRKLTPLYLREDTFLFPEVSLIKETTPIKEATPIKETILIREETPGLEADRDPMIPDPTSILLYKNSSVSFDKSLSTQSQCSPDVLLEPVIEDERRINVDKITIEREQQALRQKKELNDLLTRKSRISTTVAANIATTTDWKNCHWKIQHLSSGEHTLACLSVQQDVTSHHSLNEKKHFLIRTDDFFCSFKIPGAKLDSIQLISNFKSSAIFDLKQLIMDNSFHWQQFHFNIFSSQKSNPSFTPTLPRLVRLFHKSDCPTMYQAYPNKLSYDSECEDEFPAIKQLRQDIGKLLNYEFNMTCITNYPNYITGIGLHSDEHHVYGLSNQMGQEGEEIIASFSLLGNKITVIEVRDKMNPDTVYLMHKENSIYVMTGIQKMTRHSKLGIKMSTSYFQQFWPNDVQSSATHISIVFRRLIYSDLTEANVTFFSKIQVEWNRFKTVCTIQNNATKASEYKGLKEAEPIGFIWPDINIMVHFGAHPIVGAGIHFKNKLVYSVLDNSKDNLHLSNGEVHYFGHGVKRSEEIDQEFKIERANAALISTAKQGVGFRYYIGPNSSHVQKPNKGYLFYALMYVHAFWIESSKGLKRKRTQEKKRKKGQNYAYILKVLLKQEPPTLTQLQQLNDQETVSLVNNDSVSVIR
jgi:hypothetical protein